MTVLQRQLRRNAFISRVFLTHAYIDNKKSRSPRPGTVFPTRFIIVATEFKTDNTTPFEISVYESRDTSIFRLDTIETEKKRKTTALTLN